MTPRIRLDARGDFWCEGQRVEHPGILAMLHGDLTRLRAGIYGYRLEGLELAIEFEDAPYLVIALDATAEGLSALLSNGSWVDASGLWYEGDIPYLQTEAGDRARFTPGAALSLCPYLDDEEGQPVLIYGAVRRRIQVRA